MRLNSLYEPTSSGRDAVGAPGKRPRRFCDDVLRLRGGITSRSRTQVWDDWADDRNLVRAPWRGFSRRATKGRAPHPESVAGSRGHQSALRDREARRGGTRRPGELLGQLWAAVRLPGRPLGQTLRKWARRWASHLRDDAYDDLEVDRKKGAYNPLSVSGERRFEETCTRRYDADRERV